MHWILIIPEKPHIGPIVGYFWPQNFKNKFILKKKHISINSKLLWWCNVMQKTQKSSMHWLLIWNITWNKIDFWAHFRTLLARKPENNIFPKKLFKSILSLYATISPLTFHKAGKTSFWVYFGRSFSHKTSKQDFFSQAPFIFKVKNTLTLCKKENS